MKKMKFSYQLRELKAVISAYIRMIRSVVLNVLGCTDKFTCNLTLQGIWKKKLWSVPLLALLSMSPPHDFLGEVNWFYPSGLFSGCQTLGCLALLHPLGGKGEALIVYNPFTIAGLRSYPLIIPFLRVSLTLPPSLWSSKRLHFLTSEACRAHAEPISVFWTFDWNPFLQNWMPHRGGCCSERVPVLQSMQVENQALKT